MTHTSGGPAPAGRPGRRARLRPIAALLLTLVALAALVAYPGSSGAQTPSRATTVGSAGQADTAALPTIVLVHGAFADAGGWGAEIERLQALGYPVIAPADPLRGLTSDSDYVRSVLQTISGPIVLVGHSYGGAVITNAARGVANVVALVYVGAFIPDEGQSIATSYDGQLYPGSLLGPDTTLVRPVANPAAAGGQDLDIYIRPDQFRRVFAGDEPADTAAVMAASQRPLSLTANTEVSGPPAWRSVPSWALVTLDDRAISPGGQFFMADRAGAHVSTVHSAHDVMVSHPGAVVRTILSAVAAQG